MPARFASFAVVVVDDEGAVCEAIRSLLSSAGFSAECFASAEEFLRFHGRSQAAFLILDVRLPGMSGLELQERLRAQGIETPTLFITAYEDSDQRMRAQASRAGAVGFLRKPFCAADLLDAVQAAFEQRNRKHSPVRNC